MKIPLAVIGLRGFPGVQGGVERHCAEIIPRLGIKALVYRRKPYVSHNDKAPAGIEFKDLPSTRIKGFEAALHTMLCVAHLMIHPARVVNVHNIGPGLFTPLLKLRGMKVVLTYHSANYLHSKWGKIARAILRAGEKISLRFADRVIFVSPEKYTSFSLLGSKGVFIPNPAEIHPPVYGTGFLKKNGVEAGRYILAVGRITHEKGFDILVKAAQRINPSYKVVIAGGCDNSPALLTELKSADTGSRVVFAGYVGGEDLMQLYSHAALFVLPSRQEGLSMALLEAMGYGLPVCVSDIEANRLPQVPADSFFANGDAGALADALNSKLPPQPERHAYDLSQYSLRSVVAATRAVYESLFAR